MTVPLSILDLATIGKGQTAAESLAGSVAMAQLAEKLGYRRVWYAEHHNMSSIASSATSVLIAHIAAHTETIRLGAGGIMLPNHSPLTIAEQFGTLETLHPGRIDLGLGRAPGSDQNTLRALRRDPMSSDSFPQDVLELQGYLNGPTRIPGVEATPGKGTKVPLYILGSSLFGARLAAQLGLPYAFASHFAPKALQDAVAIYRREFKPSAQLEAPYVIAGVNVVAAESAAEAQAMLRDTLRARVSLFFGNGRVFSDAEADMILDSPQGQHVSQMMTYSAVGTPDAVLEYLDEFTAHSGADELMVAHQSTETEGRLRSVELLAETAGLVRA
ncbi:luciferase family oxidoreductase group 1 [Arthrobacter sp. V4I6]|uniref:LLM class flavin-dependent oxidoreductase n=1 Tax=unclassified Arthrobacter TaxID=235627 RepID=UPI002784530A|nr:MULTISPECIES: LLM class flavin-dependent oxidoreductase [unclassified Arthrobacter]MDQ0819129.1 luciferase family oxidoreductase group 1 [Arthrobacter sp. V1I7]MDQ0853309.1 luciferase family oxidoreductase group 1 [Arthrobacter sp. V4I6]